MLEPASLLIAVQTTDGPVEEGQHPLEVALAPALKLTGLRQARPAVLPDRLEKAIPTVVIDGRGGNERLAYQSDEKLGYGLRFDGRSDGDGLCRVDGEPAAKDSEAVEEYAFPGIEQVVAPSERCFEPRMALASAARRSPQQGEPITEARVDLGRRERAGLRGGELDGERQSVES